MAKTVSIIITCHNLENFIGISIESVLNQDYHGSAEIIVVDDFSVDRSSEIIKSYNKVNYLRTDRNMGVLMATVLGLENSRGEIVFFLDGDDLWAPNKLTQVISRFYSDPRLVFVTHDLDYIDSQGNLLMKKSRSGEAMRGIPVAEEDRMIRNGILLHSDYVWLGSAYAVHRTLGNLKGFCEFAKRLPDGFNTYQDWPLAFWVACQPDIKLGYVPEKLFSYRLHGANYSGDARSLDKAIRNIQRSWNTLKAIDEIASKYECDRPVKEANSTNLCYYSYLRDLYKSHRASALNGYIKNLPFFWSRPSLFLKETLRFIIIQIMGINGFIKVSTYIKKH